MRLEIDNIRFSFIPGCTVLDGISACTAGGGITAIVGPNAVGKTTLLRIIANLLDPDEGTVRIDGTLMSAMTARERAARLAYVAQRPTVDAPFSVRDVVSLGAYHLRVRTPAEVMNRAIEQCELASILDSRFHELSIGQQQRVSLGRVLVQLRGGGPGRLMLLDEPVSAMDPKHVIASGRILRAAADAGTTILIVLHDLNLAYALADDVWAIHHGSMVASGPIGEELTAAILEQMFETPFATFGSRAGNHPTPQYDF